MPVLCASTPASPRARAPRRAAGLTFIELLVTLVILSVLAMAALPQAELVVRRQRELELRQTLREVRSAIDAFHDDWRAGRIPAAGGDIVSTDGYPRTLQVLVDGVDNGRVAGGKRRYLRRIPRDPLSPSDIAPADQWLLRGYQDAPDATRWNGRDVYDVRSASPAQAIDGSHYRDW